MNRAARIRIPHTVSTLALGVVLGLAALTLPAAAAAQAAAPDRAQARPGSAPDAASAAASVVVLDGENASVRAAASGTLTAPVDPAVFGALDYRSIGPSRGGRVTAVAGHRAMTGTFYMGATGGGVWKTDNYGLSWRNVSDGYFATGSIGAIRVAPSDADVVYVGTGSDGIRSNVIIGKGVYRSDDGGESWRHVGLEDTGQIGAVEIHPDDPDVAYVAALGTPFGTSEHRGVFRTTDGGGSWDRILFVNDSVGAIDFELEPGNPRVMYATMWRGERKPWTIISGAGPESGDGIWRSTDGGESWERLENGLPGGLIGKADLAISPAMPNRVYAVVEAPNPDEGVYRSDDRGESWQHVSARRGLMNRPFYYTNIDVDPTDADVVYVNNEGFYKSTDAGATWERVSTPHGDNHDMWINPDYPDVFIQSNDGGANVTYDGGESWTTQLNQPTAELYQVDVSDNFPYYACSGQQDNTTICVPGRPPRSSLPDRPLAFWIHASGCETGPAVPKPGDFGTIYGNCKGRFSVFDARTGQEQNYWVGAHYMYGHDTRDLTYRFQRVSPIEVSPHDPDVVYHGSQYIHRTTDGGESWETISPDLTARPEGTQMVSGGPITRDITGEEIYSTTYAIEESPHQPGEIWVGTNDGLFHITRNGGESWTDITPADLPWGGRVQSIDVSTHTPGKAYFSVLRYQLDDFEPYAYRTDDYGATWTRITTGMNGIPADHPVRVVREDPDREGLLYAGTEFGMFISFDDGASWQPFQRDLPVTPITDLKIHEKDLVLSTMGRGFWIMDDLTPLHEVDNALLAGGMHLFAPRDAYRMRYSAFGRAGWDDPAAPEYPEPGAMLDYWLPEDADAVTVEILDAGGTVVRGFTSDDEGYAYRTMQGMRDARVERTGAPKLATEAGAHRFIWDLAYPGPWSPEETWRGRGRGGPLAVPGRYTVRLTVDGEAMERPLTVRMDPRVREAGVTLADLQDQLELNRAIRDLLSEARMAAAEIERTLEVTTDEGVRQRLEGIHAQIVTDEEIWSYPQPMLIDQIGYLYGMTTNADQRPGEDAHTRYGELRAQMDALASELEELIGYGTGDGG